MLSGLKKPLRIAVFISGSGSTLQALLEMRHQIEIPLVVSNRRSAAGLLKAKRFGIETFILNTDFDDQNFHAFLKERRIDRIMLAGFMKLLPASFVDLWKGKILNIHPSLLPQYPGLKAIEQSWQNKQGMGVSLHEVTAQMDAGPLRMQQVSLPQVGDLSFSEAAQLLRRTEQHLLREMSLKWN